MGRPDIVSGFRGRMVQLETVEGTTLHVHAEILDSGQGIRPDVPWDSFKTSTVERYLEYCYQGDYSVPKPVKEPLATPTSTVDDDDEYAEGVFHPSFGFPHRCGCVNRWAIRQDYNDSCHSNIEDDDGDDNDDIEDVVSAYEFNKDENDEASDTEGRDTNRFGSSGHPNGLDYGEVFLAHAELCILSQTQGRSSLTSLCLYRLHKALDKAAKAPVRPRFASNLSDLLLYVYEHDNVSLIDDDQARNLQNLASSCAARHIKEMKEECSSLMKCGGKMAEDLMKEVVDRMINLEIVSEEYRELAQRDLGGVHIG